MHMLPSDFGSTCVCRCVKYVARHVFIIYASVTCRDVWMERCVMRDVIIWSGSRRLISLSVFVNGRFPVGRREWWYCARTLGVCGWCLVGIESRVCRHRGRQVHVREGSGRVPDGGGARTATGWTKRRSIDVAGAVVIVQVTADATKPERWTTCRLADRASPAWRGSYCSADVGVAMTDVQSLVATS